MLAKIALPSTALPNTASWKVCIGLHHFLDSHVTNVHPETVSHLTHLLPLPVVGQLSQH